MSLHDLSKDIFPVSPLIADSQDNNGMCSKEMFLTVK